MESRQSARPKVLIEAPHSTRSIEGEAVLASASSAGALLEDVSVCPPVDVDVNLVVLLGEDKTVHLAGVVSRHTSSGFEVRFKRHSEEILTLLEALK